MSKDVSKEMTNDELLKALLDVEDTPMTEIPMPRFGENAVFKVKALDGKTINRIREESSHTVGKGNKREKILNEEKMYALVIVKSCVTPNWQDKKLLDKYNTSDASDVVLKRLLAGEIEKISQAVLKLSGFSEDEGEDQVKNS